MILNTSFTERKLGPDSFIYWSNVDMRENLWHSWKLCSVWEKNLSSTTLVVSLRAVWEIQCRQVWLWQDFGCYELTFLVEKTNSSLIYQSIDLSDICLVFYKAVPEENLTLWIWSFLALRWFYDILAAQVCSKSILTCHGNFFFREILRWLLSYSPSHIQHTNTAVILSFLNQQFLNHTNTNW